MMRHLILTAGSSLALTACIELPGTGPAPDHYTLSPLTAVSEEKSDLVLVLDEPSMPGELLDSDIAVSVPESQRVLYVSGSRWTQRTPNLLHRYFVASFDNSARWLSVGGPSALEIRADFRLKLDVHRFHAVLDPAPKAEVAVSAKLVRNGPAELIAARQFQAEAPASSQDAAALTRALDTALDDLTRRLIAWVDEQDTDARAAR